ncbi:MAG: FAD-dependent oxidoreductase [Nitrospirota bacterium]
MPPSSRYDAVIVGGGLAGVATAALLAKRGRRVALCEPRPSWGGLWADRRLGAVSVVPGPRAVVGHERLGWADRYFEAIGLSLPLMTREGATFRRDPVQVIWGPHRLTVTSDRGEMAEELRREYRAGPSEVAALWADLDAAYDTLAPRFDPSPLEPSGHAWSRLRHRASARAFVSRFGGLSVAEYARARNLADVLIPYLDAWRAVLSLPGDTPGAWLFRVASAHRGLVAVPGGLADVCAMLASRVASHGGDVIRTPVASVGGGSAPFVETDGQRLTARAVILSAGFRPRTEDVAPASVTSAAAFSAPSSCVPEAMAGYVLATDGTSTWSLARRRVETAGGAFREALTVSCRGRLQDRDAKPLADRLAEVMPFAEGRLTYDGITCDQDVPDPVDATVWGAAFRRSRGLGWAQAGRSPVWWVPDVSDPWLGDARAYCAALVGDRVIGLQ